MAARAYRRARKTQTNLRTEVGRLTERSRSIARARSRSSHLIYKPGVAVGVVAALVSGDRRARIQEAGAVGSYVSMHREILRIGVSMRRLVYEVEHRLVRHHAGWL